MYAETPDKQVHKLDKTPFITPCICIHFDSFTLLIIVNDPSATIVV